MNSPDSSPSPAGQDSSLPCFPVLQAGADWRRIDFLSDLHLSPETPATLAALESHLQETTAEAVILLGDIFEVWVGDDGRFEGFEAQVLGLLQAASRRLQLFFMAGNRDFLLGAEMLADAGMQGLADPTVLIAFGERWLLSHGDALCLSDQAYQAFRKQVRRPEWQAQFLAQPLAARRAIARQMRDGSKAQQAEVSEYADLDRAACVAWLQASGCKTLIHGHTHRPAVHELGVPGLRRQVLSDWDLEAEVPRADLLRLRQAGLRRIQLV